MRQRLGVIDALVGRCMHEGGAPTRDEQSAEQSGDAIAIHPVE